MEINYKHIGWCHDEANNHDKVWGAIRLSDEQKYWGDYCVFWGRRGRALQFKIHKGESDDTMEMLFEKKQRKGYAPVDSTKLYEVYPEFQEDLEKTAVWAILSA